MSKSLQIVDDIRIPDNQKFSYSLKTYKNKHILKPKENIFKPKCNRELKKKLKKYKLRRDGIEDPDILDVSQILVTSLRIKSPNSQEKVYCNNNIIETEEFHSGVTGNYLFKMVRRKKTSGEIESLHSDISNNDKKVNETIFSVLPNEISDKKHMDAFKLMMDARNKSIGTNSPGKEKIEELDVNETFEKKENRAKRILSLQKMALAKGSIKNKEIEELRDRYIENKMVKRAERFKDMITKADCIDKKRNNSTEKKSSLLNGIDDLASKCVKNKSLELCDIFNETTGMTNHCEQSKMVPKEDIEFLNKLSPSLKKKENMLSYFKKVSKEDCEHAESNNSTDNNKPIIKVKFNSKRKKKIKLLQPSEGLNSPPKSVETEVVTICTSNEPPLNNHKRYKRKRNLNKEEYVSPASLESKVIVKEVSNENRPKRNVKKPIKYTEDVQIFSSDEELHIFTPKKKKNTEKSLKLEAGEEPKDVPKVKFNKDEQNKLKVKEGVLKLSNGKQSKNKIKLNKKGDVHTKNSSKSVQSDLGKKAVKLAPIFVAKMQLSPADIEAKQNFLKSGVPEKLKKKAQQSINIIPFDIFPSVVHIQQHCSDISLLQGTDWFSILEKSVVDEISMIKKTYLYKSLLTLEESTHTNKQIANMHRAEKMLKTIKNAYPKFPVYRTYHLLSGKSKGEFKDCNYPELDNSVEIINGCIDINNANPEQLNWCDKYKPTSSKQIIGNFESIKELRKWLETWTENLEKAKQIASDESDFSDFYHSDTDSRTAMKNLNNVLILTGQTGSGKTNSVYAVASELAIKVIEVNASSKRTGKIMLQDLQEATQSHKVDRGKSGLDSSQKIQEDIIPTRIKKRGRPKKTNNSKLNTGGETKRAPHNVCEISQIQISSNQDNVRTGMSLILIDDADIVFEQDDGFCSAVSQLIQSSKRPVILISSSLSSPHLQRFLQIGKVLHMQPLLPRMLGTWLDIMCLADVGKCYTGLGAKVLDFYRGDIRKAINYLQFYMNSHKHINQGNESVMSQVKYNVDDENSSMSWAECENSNVPINNDNEAEMHVDRHLQMFHFESSSDIFDFWWNFQSHYNDNNVNIEGHINTKKEESTAKINEIAHILDTVSMIDCFDCSNSERTNNITTRPWHGPESPSLFENENLDYYNKSSCVTKEISSVLMKTTISAAENISQQENRLLHPNMSIVRTRDKVVSRHNKLSSYLNPTAILDRHAIALDYWPACRSICRIEKSKTDSNVKRNNRYCHYLKSLNVLCKNDFFDSLADSLS